MVVQGNKKDKEVGVPRSMKMKNIAGLSNNTTFSTLTIPFSFSEFSVASFKLDQTDRKRRHTISPRLDVDTIGQTFTCTRIGFLSSIKMYVRVRWNNGNSRTRIQLREYNGDELTTAFNGKLLATSLPLPEMQSNETQRIHTFQFPRNLQNRVLLVSGRKYTIQIVGSETTLVSSQYTYSDGRALPSLAFKDIADTDVSIREGFSSMIFEVRAYLDFSAGFN